MSANNSASTSNTNTNSVRLSFGPHMALKTASLCGQRRNLVRRLDQLNEKTNDHHNHHHNFQQQSSLEKNVAQEGRFYPFPSSLPYPSSAPSLEATTQEQQQQPASVPVVPPAPAQSLRGTGIGVFRPPTRYLRSVQPQETAQQLLSIAQKASIQSSPYNPENITSNQAPVKSKEDRERNARDEKELEEDIKELKEKVRDAQQAVLANNNNNNTSATATTTNTTATTGKNPHHVFHATAKPFVSSISVTNTRQGFQMNAVVNAASFTPAFLRNQQQQQEKEKETTANTTKEAMVATPISSTSGKSTPLREEEASGSSTHSRTNEEGEHGKSTTISSSSSSTSHPHNNTNNQQTEQQQQTAATSVFNSKFNTTPNTPFKNNNNNNIVTDEQQQQDTTKNKIEEQQETQKEESSSNSVTSPIFTSLPMTELDAVYIRMAPMPMCFNDNKIETSSDNDNENEKKKDDDENTASVYSIDDFMALRHNVNSLKPETARTILEVVYHDWEKHLQSAISSCKAGSSSLMVSDRNLPPLFVGRSEYHEMVEERVSYFSKNPEALNKYKEEKNNNNNQNQQVCLDGVENNENKSDANNNNKKTFDPKSDYEAASVHLSDFTTIFGGGLSALKKNGGDSATNAAAGGSESASGNVSPTRGGLFALPTYGRPQKLHKSELHNKVLSILSRVTPEKYHALREELLNLPIRQASEEQMTKVVDVFFHKAVQEQKFSGVYADLVMSVFETAQEEKEALMHRQQSGSTASFLTSPQTAGSNSQNQQPQSSPQFPAASGSISSYSPTPMQSESLTAFEARSAARTEQLAHRLRTALLKKCHAEFSREPKLREKDLVDKETGKPLSREDQEDMWSSLKKRLKGNVRFVGELYNRGAVTDDVVNAALSVLLMQIGALATEKIPSYARGGACQCFNDHLVDVFVTLLDTVGPKFRCKMPERCNAMVETARKLSETHKTPRTRVLLMNLVDNADGKGEKRWNNNNKHQQQQRHSHISSTFPSVASFPSKMGSMSRMGSTQDFSISSSAGNNHHHKNPTTSNSHLSMTGTPVSPHHHGHHHHHGFGGSGSGMNLASSVNSDSNSTTASASAGPSSASKPPPPSYITHLSNSNPTSPTSASAPDTPPHNGFQPSQQGGGNRSALPPPLRGSNSSSNLHAAATGNNNNNAASNSTLSSPPSSSSPTSTTTATTKSSSSSSGSIFLLSRSASPEMKNSLASLPSSSHCDLCAEECVSLSEALCGIEHVSATTENQNQKQEQEQQEHHHLLSFIPVSAGPSQRQAILNKKVWQPAEKLAAIAHNEGLVTELFTTMIKDNVVSSDSDDHTTASPVLKSGLGFLIAHSIATPSSNGSGNRILDPQVAKSALTMALSQSGVVLPPKSPPPQQQQTESNNEGNDSSDDFLKRVRILCVGGDETNNNASSVHEHQSRASKHFEALGGGNEESEGYTAAQRLFRSWGKFVTGNF